MNKLLRKIFISLVLTLVSYSLSLFLFLTQAIQICFCKVAGENGKKLLPEICLSYQKGIFPIFSWSFNFLEVYASAANDFRVRTNVYYKKRSQIRNLNIFNIINIIVLCLCDVWKRRSYVNSNVSDSSIFKCGHFYVKYYFLHHIDSPLKRFS